MGNVYQISSRKPIEIAVQLAFYINGFSQLRRQSLRNKKPPAMRVRDTS